MEDNTGLRMASVWKLFAVSEYLLFNINDCLASNNPAISFYCREFWGVHEDAVLSSVDLGTSLCGRVAAAMALELLAIQSVGRLCGSPRWKDSICERTISQLRTAVSLVYGNSAVLLDLALTSGDDNCKSLHKTLLLCQRLPVIPPKGHAAILKSNSEQALGTFRKILNVESGLPSTAQGLSDLKQKVFARLEFRPIGKCAWGWRRWRWSGKTLVCHPVIWFEPIPPMTTLVSLSNLLTNHDVPPKLTVVLDLDETLVYFSEMAGKLLIRPGCVNFLNELHNRNIEIVFFTAATEDYGSWVVDCLENLGAPKGLNKLFRQHALPCGPIFLKDLSRLGRDLTKTVIVDNIKENFSLQSAHGIFIKTWQGEPDHVLSALQELIISMASSSQDVSQFLKSNISQLKLIEEGFLQKKKIHTASRLPAATVSFVRKNS